MGVQIVAESGVEEIFSKKAARGTQAFFDYVAARCGIPYEHKLEIVVHLFQTTSNRLKESVRFFDTSEDQARQFLGMELMGGKGPIANADAQTRTVWMRLDEPALRSSAPGWSVEKIVAHEVCHLWQFDVADPRSDPAWLTEGLAEHIAFQSAIQADVFTLQALRQYCRPVIQRAMYSLASVRLQELTGLEPFVKTNNEAQSGLFCLLNAYFQFLQERSRMSGHRVFFQARRGGADWLTAFQKAFHRLPTLEDQDFVSYLQSEY